jgi:hypothetical protein
MTDGGARRERRGKRDSETKAAVKERGSLILGLLLDTLVSLTAVGCRWLLLWAVGNLSPEEQKGWVLQSLFHIFDFGLIATAALYFVFGVMKLIVRGWKSFREATHE